MLTPGQKPAACRTRKITLRFSGESDSGKYAGPPKPVHFEPLASPDPPNWAPAPQQRGSGPVSAVGSGPISAIIEPSHRVLRRTNLAQGLVNLVARQVEFNLYRRPVSDIANKVSDIADKIAPV